MSNHSTAFSETLVDEWVRHGLQHAIIAPGSRSTPLALALAQADGIEAQVVLDERVATFMALGIGLADQRPALVLTTSGTATTHLHAAVVEAHLAEVPLLVCTADRPPELYGVGAAQTIHQQQLFGGAARAYLELGPRTTRTATPGARWPREPGTRPWASRSARCSSTSAFVSPSSARRRPFPRPQRRTAVASPNRGPRPTAARRCPSVGAGLGGPNRRDRGR